MKWLILTTVALLPTLTMAHSEELNLSTYQTENEMPSDVFQELGNLDSSVELGEEELDFDAHRNGRRHGHPGFPGWRNSPRNFPLPIFRQHNVCFARNARGVTYRVSGFAPRRVIQNEAVRFCERNSARPWTCRPLGCR
jgi:hypothetical protein